ncbi:hypothetical protein ACFOLF_27280 [Paenibacillus sepulcri]|uniref:ABC transporter permease n=1 Tax=Paenibacillus sepulcri TaxID=359917 RepID=A0ABS7C6F7_9BACL|nr:ABC transporter permease [Paenibacillus sepulcri]
MRTLVLQIRLELQLLYKRRWPLLLPPAAGVWMLLQCFNSRQNQLLNLNLKAAEAHGTIMMFVTLVPILLGVLLIRRDTLHASFEWSLGLPVTNRVIIASKWTAGFVYMSVFTLLIQASYAAAAWHYDLASASALREIIWYSLFYEMSFAAGTALGILLGALMPLRFSLPIGFCGWVFGALFVPSLLVEGLHWYPVKVFSLNQLMGISSYANNEIWTFELISREYMMIGIFGAAFSLFMLTAAGALFARERPVYKAKTPFIIMMACLLLSAAAYVPYSQLWSKRYDQQRIMHAAAKPDANINQHIPYQFQISSMALDIVRHSDNSLEMKARIVLPTRDGKLIPASGQARQVAVHYEGQISFLLDPLLQVLSLKVDGNPAPWRRDGDFISFGKNLLERGRDDHVIEIAYGGILNEWRADGGTETRFAFVQGRNVLLPAHLGWFPIPGGDTLKMINGSFISDRVDVITGWRTNFDVKLHGFAGPIYASIAQAPDDNPDVRHFVQKSAEAPFIFGGDFTEVRIPGEPVTVITTPGSIKDSRLFLSQLNQKRSYYSSWSGMPLDNLKQVLYFPMGGLFPFFANASGIVQGNMFLIQANRYSSLTTSGLEKIMSTLLFGDNTEVYMNVNNWDDYPDPESSYSIVQEIRSAILSLDQKEAYSGTDPTFSIQIMGDSPPSRLMAAMINDAFSNGEADLVKRVLLRFLHQGLQVRDLFLNLPYYNSDIDRNPFRYPLITWNDWLRIWNEEKGR